MNNFAAKASLKIYPASARHWLILALAWAHFIASLFLPAAFANFLIRYHGSMDGLTFHRWLFLDLPPWILANSRGYRAGYLSPLDLIWYFAAVFAVLFFFFAPLAMRYIRRPTPLIVMRCLSLILLTFPITLFLPSHLKFPTPQFGMYLLAASHLLTLIALWIPRNSENILDADNAFTVQLNNAE